jgi:hypothetical protein
MLKNGHKVESAKNEVAFLALIKSVIIKSLVSGDKSVRIVLEVDSPTDEVLQSINRVHIADKQIAVGLAEVKGNPVFANGKKQCGIN